MTDSMTPQGSRAAGGALKILRSIGAVVAGFVAVFALSTLGDMAMLALGVFPKADLASAYDARLLAIALSYRLVFTVAGGWLAARLAPSRPMTHALVLGAIGFLAATAGAVVMWKVGQHWYPVALVVTALPCCWLGGRLAARRA